MMGTQSIPSSESFNKPAPATLLHRTRILPRTQSATPARASAIKERRMTLERQRLLIELLPLVKWTAFKIREYLPAHVELDDLIANGLLGLVDAISKFDPSKHVKLESYARHRVRGSILDGLRSVDPASRDLRKKSKQIQKLYRELESKLGRPITDEEIAGALGLSLEKWHDTLSEVQTLGFDFGARPISAGPTSKRVTAEPVQLAGDDADPFDLCYQREKQEILARALGRLREREREIIGFYYYQELTMKQIAARMNIDESRVSQLHSAAISRLRANVKSLLRPNAGHAAAAGTLSLSLEAGA